MFLRLIIITVALLLPFSIGFAATSKNQKGIQPRWVQNPISTLNPNASFLADLDRDSSNAANFQNEILDPARVPEIKQSYRDMMRDYEMRQQYGLTDLQAEQNHSSQVNDFGKGFLSEFKRIQRNKGIGSVRAAAKRDENLAKPLPKAVIGALVIACTGEAVDLVTGDEAKLTARTNLPDGSGQLAVASSIVNGSFEIANRSSERYRLSVARGIPGLDISSGLSYGASSNTVSASLSKPISNHLTAVLDSSRSMTDKTRGPDGTVRLLYGINF